MLRADPPSFVLIDYAGSKETLWPAALGYGAKGQGGQRFRPPTEATDAPVMSTHGDFFSSRSYGGARFLSPGGGRAPPRHVHWRRQKPEAPPKR